VKSDLIIIGGGIIGLYSAYLLAQSGIKITLIDKGNFGQESSWAAGGILSPLLPWHYSDKVLSLTRSAARDYKNLSTHLAISTGLDIEYWKCGLTIHETVNDDISQWCDQHNIICQQIENIQQNHIHLPDIAQVRMPLVIKALVELLQRENVTLLNNTDVLNYQIHNRRITAVGTRDGDIHTENVLSTTGAWRPETDNARLSVNWPAIIPIKGQMIAMQAIPGLLRNILYKDGHYLIPRKDGLIIAGSTIEHVGYTKQITNSARETLWQNSLDIYPELERYPITHQWAGIRPGTADNVPTIGPHPELEGLYLNCGHFRYGVAMAPMSAHIIREWLLNDGKTLTGEQRCYAGYNFA
tara:strand:- start:72 stop:1136 length:1065 start_codon:yes stop_codon:yes gene_type:complete